MPPTTTRSTTATQYYRGQWSNERGFHRFKKGDIPALPLWLRLPERIKGLMFLLTITLQLLTLIEFVTQRELNLQNQPLTGLVPGNPKMKSTRPSAKRILAQFSHIHLAVTPEKVQRVETLNPLQLRLLQLMKTPVSLYEF